ncbi:MAG: hypothetical protein ABSH52_01345 [Terriglobia bacterium]|jgi:hypothetical protein
MATQSKNPSAAQVEARRRNSHQSTGPRTGRGKRHSSRNALKHGLYADVRFFFWDAAMELGEDPREFQRLFAGLLEARGPADTLEQVLVEDIAVLVWKKARLERAESAVQVCNVRKHDLERRKQYIQVGRDVTTMSQSDAFEKGLRVTLDAPGKFEKVLSMLGMLEDLTERNEFSDDMHRLLLALYGEKPTMRGVGLLNQFVKLRKLRAEGQEFEKAKTVFDATLAEETTDVLEEYELFLHEHVENTRAARIAATAPSHAQWAAIIRQQNALHRQLERKIRLLDEMQERRRKMGSATDLLAKLAGVRNRFNEPDGGGPAPTTPNPSSSEEGSRFDPAPATSNPSGAPCAAVAARHGVPLPESVTNEAGVAHTSRCSVSGCMRLSPESRPDRVADMPNGGTSAPPPDVGAVREPPVPESATDVPPAPAENTQNRGNEAKKSLKTNDWAKIECAIRMPFSTQKVPNDAKNVSFRCAVGFATRAIEM